MAAGADALAMAGGDGSQAIVAEIAAAQGLPYACIPAGTRNHFALDLGVDRDDVVGALDALVDGRERRVDLAEVNGRVFVNNVSLGLYAGAVQQEGYRDAKLRTLLAVAPAGLGADPDAPPMRWRGADGGAGRRGRRAARLKRRLPARHRDRLGDEAPPRRGVLGIASLTAEPRRGAAPTGLALAQWSTPTFTVEADGPGGRRHRRRGRHPPAAGPVRSRPGVAPGPDRTRPTRGLAFDRGATGLGGDDRRLDRHRPRPTPQPSEMYRYTKGESSDGRLRGGAT